MSRHTEPAAIPVALLIRVTRDPEAFTRRGAAHARRRTLAAGILPCARSMLTSLRHPWLRLSATPAPGHGQPLAASSRSTGFQPVCLPSSHWARGIIACMCDFGRGSSRIGGTRRSRCDLCNAAVAPKRLSRELTSPAGAEHASGRLRWPFEARGSSTTRLNARRSPRPGHGPAARRRSLWSAVGRPGSVRTPPPPA